MIFGGHFGSKGQFGMKIYRYLNMLELKVLKKLKFLSDSIQKRKKWKIM